MTHSQLIFLGPALFGLIVAGGCMAMLIYKLLHPTPIITDPLREARMAVYEEFRKSLQDVRDDGETQ